MTETVLVFGASGQVANAIKKFHNKPDLVVIAAGRDTCNIANVDEVFQTLDWVQPDFVVNAAAYTAVDKAQYAQEEAFLINEYGARNVAAAAYLASKPIIHISTDYVFSGEKKEPYLEFDITHPVNIYGQSKLAGEISVKTSHPQHIILRTSWVYSSTGSNFVKTMLKLAVERNEIAVVCDQSGNPTSADEIAGAIISILQKVRNEPSKIQYGTYHFCGSLQRSWAEFADDILTTSQILGGPSASIIPVSTQQYGSETRRPAMSTLDTSLFKMHFDYKQVPYEYNLQKVVSEILNAENY